MIYSDRGFLPVSKEDMDYLGWDELDFLYITGDAYVDHPSFAHAIISRVLTAEGYRVGIIAQPDISTQKSITIMGKPRLGVLISAGNMDSMVNHYTVSKKKRTTDAYSPAGKMGLRPDRATIVYANLARRTFGKIPILIGGIEASLRRFAHYDYWQDAVRRSILDDSGADILMYGMGEHSIVEIARALDNGTDVSDIRHVRGTCYMTKDLEKIKKYIEIPSFDEVKNDKVSYAKAHKIQ
ncbi:MAG: YgiQ family radical SAM protein, partial [Clostridia bacterium]|nr:YgiQ family radical SAM protein [Clostridia bacterium]